MTKKYMYVTQIGGEVGHDVAWSTLIVLGHDLSMGDPVDGTWRQIDNLLGSVDLDYNEFELDYYTGKAAEGDVEVDRGAIWPAFIETIKPRLEKLGFEYIGEASFAFNNTNG